MPHLGGPGVTLGWLGAAPVRAQPEGMTILLHPTAYRAAGDEQLVDLVRAGDDRAFDAIHARYEQRLTGYARQMLGGSHHDAEEIVQDAFVRALAALRADSREMALRRGCSPSCATARSTSCDGRCGPPTSRSTRRCWATPAPTRTSRSCAPPTCATSSASSSACPSDSASRWSPTSSRATRTRRSPAA